MTIEKRQYERFAFPKGADIRATLVPLNGGDTVEAVILNVSKGGVGLAAQKLNRNSISEEVDFRVENVTSGAGLPCLKGQLVRVKWVLDYAQLNNYGIGCEFIDLNEECHQELDELFSQAS